MDDTAPRGRRRRPAPGLSPEEKATKDKRAQHWRNVMKMHRVHESAVLAAAGYSPDVIRATYQEIHQFHARHNGGA